MNNYINKRREIVNNLANTYHSLNDIYYELREIHEDNNKEALNTLLDMLHDIIIDLGNKNIKEIRKMYNPDDFKK